MTSSTEAYRLGRDYTVMPIPMDPDQCVEVDAGPLVFVAESRVLSARGVREHAATAGMLERIDDVEGLEDSGLSIHVLDAADRGEHLRFDCFENDPHYHYIRQAAGNNTVVRFDDIADDDPLAWTLGRLRTSLPRMLDHVGLAQLAEQVRARHDEVARSIDELERVLEGIEPVGSDPSQRVR